MIKEDIKMPKRMNKQYQKKEIMMEMWKLGRDLKETFDIIDDYEILALKNGRILEIKYKEEEKHEKIKDKNNA